MKKVFLVAIISCAVALTPACSNFASLDSARVDEAGSVGEVLAGTVIQASKIRIDASESTKNLGTASGAIAGTGLGSLLGSGSGSILSSVGIGLVGTLAGHAVGKYAGQADGQELLIKADESGKTYRIRQNIYEEIGEIPVGAHGYFTIGGSSSIFRPDGQQH